MTDNPPPNFDQEPPQEYLPEEDPRLLAYSLGELSPEESAEVEQLLQNDPNAREQLAALQHFGECISADLEEETENLELDTQRKRTIHQAIRERTRIRSPWRHIGLWCAVIAILLALLGYFVVITTLNKNQQKTQSTPSEIAPSTTATSPTSTDAQR